MKIWTIACLAVFLSSQAFAAPKAMVWPEGKHAAIVLTYDDALHSQLDVAVPQLNAAHMKGTFFLDGDITPNDMRRWRKVTQAGHELGNHSVNHPCPRGMLPTQTQYVSDNYTPKSMTSEIAVMNNVLFGIDGKERHNLAYPCSQTLAGGIDYVDTLHQAGLVTYARTGGDPYNSVVTDFTTLNPFRVPSNGPVDHPDGATLIAYVERVKTAGGLGVLQFHGVGGDYLDVSSEAHQALVTYLQAHPDIWVATFDEVMDYVTAHRPQ